MHFDTTLRQLSVVLLLTGILVFRGVYTIAPKETVFRLPPLHTELIPGNKLRCYDCSYHYARGTYTQCRLPGRSPWGPRQIQCDGKCFVRRDPNGYIFRGCANEASFPFLDMKADNCSHQGEPSSLWWMCERNDCNSVDIVRICSDKKLPTAHRFSICDGSCRDPSGIYPDPFRDNSYIQCGGGLIGAKACTCCKEYRFVCPGKTSWHQLSRQCRAAPDGAVFGQGYKYGFV